MNVHFDLQQFPGNVGHMSLRPPGIVGKLFCHVCSVYTCASELDQAWTPASTTMTKHCAVLYRVCVTCTCQTCTFAILIANMEIRLADGRDCHVMFQVPHCGSLHPRVTQYRRPESSTLPSPRFKFGTPCRCAGRAHGTNPS